MRTMLSASKVRDQARVLEENGETSAARDRQIARTVINIIITSIIPIIIVDEGRPSGIAKYSATTDSELALTSVDVAKPADEASPTSHHGSSEQWIEETFAQIVEATSKMDQRSFQEFADQLEKFDKLARAEVAQATQLSPHMKACRASHPRHKPAR